VGMVLLAHNSKSSLRRFYGGQHVEGAEGLVHEEDLRLDDQGAAKPTRCFIPPIIPSGRRPRKPSNPTVSSIFMLRSQALAGGQCLGLATGFDIFQHRQPGKRAKL